MKSIFDITATGGDQIAKTLTSVNRLLGGTQKATAAIAKQGGVARAIAGSDQDVQRNYKVIEQVNKRLIESQRVVELIEKKMQTTGRLDSWERLRASLSRYKGEVDELTAMQQELLGVMEDIGDMDFGSFGGGFGVNPLAPLRTAGMTLSGIGGFDSQLGQIGEAMSRVAEFADSTQMLAQELRDAGGAIKSVWDNLKSLREAGMSANGGIKSLASGLTSANGIALLVQANLLVWGEVFKKMEEQSRRAEEAVQAYIEAKQRERDLNREIAQQLKEGDIEGATQAFEDAWQTFRDANDDLSDLQRQLADVNAEYASMGAAFDPARRNQLKADREALEKAISEFYAPGGTLDVATQQIAEYSEALPEIESAARAIEAQERLQQAEEELIALRLQAQESAEAYAEAIRDFEEQLAFDRSRELEDRQISDRRALSDHLAELSKMEMDSHARIEDLRSDHLESLADLQEDYAKQEADAQKQLARAIEDIYADLTESIADANEDFQESQRERREAYQKQRAKAEEEYERERLRRIQDMNDDLLAAEMANDVVAFIAARKAANKDLKRMEEDHKRQQDESRTEFREEQRLAREQHMQRLADMRQQAEEQRQTLLAQAAEERQARAESYAEQLTQQNEAFAKQLLAEKEQYEEQFKAAEEAFEARRELEDEDRALADRRRQEDAQRQLDQMDKQFKKEMDALKRKESDLLVVYNSKGREQVAAVTLGQTQMVGEYQRGAQMASTAVRTEFQRLYAQLTTPGGLGAGSASGTTPGDWRAAGLRPPGAVLADKGAFADKPRSVILGERRPEVVLPLDRSGGIAPDILNQMAASLRGGGGHQTVFDFRHMQVGGGVSEAFMKDQLTAMANTIVRATADARAGMKAS